jgi:hypothetical protein
MDSYISNNKGSINRNINNENINGRILFKSYNSLNNNNIEYINQRYDQKYTSLLNKLSLLISKFCSILKKLINDISNISITLGNQTIYSKSLLLDMNKNDEKYFQLNDRIEMINDTKKLLDNNLSITNNNLNIFISEVKKKIEEFKKIRNQKICKIYHMNSNNKHSINSTSQDEINNEYNCYLKSNSKDIYSNDLLNNYQLNNNKKSNTSDNFMHNLKKNYFNSINSDNDSYFNCKSDENIFKENNNNNYKHLSPKPAL